MYNIRRAISSKITPTIALFTGAVVAGGLTVGQLMPSNEDDIKTNPWTADNPLVIGAFIPPISSLPTPPPGSNNLSQPAASNPLMLPTTENYEVLRQKMELALEKYFEESSAEDVDVFVELDTFTPSPNDDLIESLTNKIKNKEWDIAFTTIPTISVRAKENDYVFAARMLPNAPNLNYAFFVRRDSPIQSIRGLDPNTKIALGELGSELFFLFPVYDLYGSDLTADAGNLLPTIFEKVGKGEADIGVGLVQLFDIRPDLKEKFRFITEGRDIPASGVYLSPEFENYHDLLQNVLLSMPEDIQRSVNYGAGEEPDYQFMEGVMQRAEAIVNCRQFTKPEPVKFYCPGELPSAPDTGVVGRANGYDFDGDNLEVRLQSERPGDSNTYTVVIPKKILNTDTGIPSSAQEINGEYLHVDESIVPTGSNPATLTVTEKGQIKRVKRPDS